ncbi:MAG: isopentenyl-diphosphate Delta-isomerase [Chitinophagaceae bacterium]|nr:isopentenyl-diphosphate Delta-isomerase [Chitinophagaceae bacterium]
MTDQAHDIILVNANDEQVGTMEKMETHRKALLHRAFSVFIFNSKGEMLLQQRAKEKYHSPGLWTNSCCSHPKPGEETIAGAQRRLQEELGFSVPLEKAFDFIYRAEFDNGLTENEYDHVLLGGYEGVITPNPAEVADYHYKPMDEIKADMVNHPEKYTAWFKIAFPKLEAYFRQKDLQRGVSGIEPEVKIFFGKIIHAVSALVLWAIISMFFGLYLNWAVVYETVNVLNIIFYAWFIISLGGLIYYLTRVWKK